MINFINSKEGTMLNIMKDKLFKNIKSEAIADTMHNSGEMLGMAIDSAELGTCSIHAITRVFLPSRHFKEILGLSANDEVTYETFCNRIVEEYQGNFTDTIETSIIRGDKCDLEFPLEGYPDGHLRWVRMIGNLFNDQEKKTAYFAGILNDITIHKQDELRKNDFIAMVSHDLRSPLTSLQAYIQLITLKVKQTDDAFVKNSLFRVNILIKKMNSMVNGFLTVSNLEEGKIHLDLERFQLNGLIDEVIADFLIVNKTIDIVFTKGSGSSVKADRDKIGQVLNNLLSNAIKYAPNQKTVEISSKDTDGRVEVRVKDHGIGIKRKDQPRLFDRYFRVNSGNTKSVPGFGLGLYLSAEIIRRHNGKVWVESKIGNGSSFYFSLPAADKLYPKAQ